MITSNEIDDITKIITEDYEPDRIILFGSYAKGNANSNSDLDLLIVSEKEKDKPRWKRGLSLLYKLRKYHFSKDILIYSQEEIEKWKHVDSAFITEINKNGVVLYER
jgi:predicted nucleotidyltransferase